MSDLDKKLVILVKTEEELRHQVETLNAHFTKVEAALAEFSCATAQVLMPETTEDLQAAYGEADAPEQLQAAKVFLAYCKDGKAYRLQMVTQLDDDENTESISITSATLRQRIEAAKLLPQLVEQLTLRTSNIINQIKEAVAQAI